MLNKRTSLSVAIGLVLGTVVCVSSANAEDNVEKMQKMKVTGSHIATTDMEGPSPVDVYTAKDIKQMGATDVSDVLRGLTQNGGNSYGASFTNSFAAGSSGVSMRGLGQSRTLVLLNGHRVANYAFAQNTSDTFVDLNSIPLSAVERIDILKDGASAIYGADAIGGVINLITKRDYEGFDFNAKVGETTKKDGETLDLTATGGKNFNDGLTNVMVTANFVRKNNIEKKNRSNTHTADQTRLGGDDWRSSYGVPGTVMSDATGNEIDSLCGGSEDCVYDFAEYGQIAPETERFSLLSTLTHQLNPDLTLNTELSYNRVQTKTHLAPTPDSELTRVGAANPNNTYGEDVYLYHRIMEAGVRKNEITTDSVRFVTGLEGYTSLFETEVDWSVSGGYHYTKTKSEGKNYVTKTGYKDAIDSGAYNPFVANNDPSSLANAKANTEREGESKLAFFNADASFPVYAMSAGDMQLAVGTEFRYEAGEDTPDPLNASNSIIGSGGTGSDGHRNVVAAYSELHVPLHETLEMQLAARGEHYSDFGSAFSPKVALRYQPSEIIMFRSSYSEGFKAPTLPEVNMSDTRSYQTVKNPRKGDEKEEVEVVSGGNKDLEAEHSYSFNFGTVVNPTDGLTLKLDYFHITNTNMIDTLDTQDLVDNNIGVTYEPDGRVRSVQSSYLNVSKQEVSGLDGEIHYIFDTANVGEFKTTLRGTYNIEHKRSDSEGNVEEYIGTYYDGARFKGKANLVWNIADYSVVNTVNYTGGYTQRYETPGHSNVEAWKTWDAQVSYSGFDRLTLTFGIDNVLDEEAPFYNYSDGYDIANANNIGRYVYAGLSYSL